MKLSDLMKMKGTYIFCPRCGSPMVHHGRPRVENNGDFRTEVYTVSCCSCGLEGQIEENWHWKEGKSD